MSPPRKATYFAGRCHICGSREEGTREDVLPQWLRSAELAILPGDVANLFPRIRLRVCRTCNATMNAQLEEPARPVILKMRDAESFLLTLEEQDAVGRWALKTALLRSYHRLVVLQEPVLIHGVQVSWRTVATRWRHLLFRLVRQGKPPKDSSVRAVLILQTTDPSGAGRRAAPRRFGPRFLRLPNHSLSSMDVVGPLALEVLIEFEGRDRLAEWTTENSTYVKLIAPPSNSALKWPPRALSWDDAEGFFDMWGQGDPMYYIK